jgi:chemotaxis protein CheC
MFIYIDFAVRDRNVNGYVAMLMDMPSLVALQGLLADFIKRTTGGTAT